MEKLQTKIAIDLGNGFIKGKSKNLELIIPSSIILKKNIADNEEDLGKNYNLYCINDIEFVAGKALENPNFVIEAKDLLSSYTKNSNRYKLDTFKLLMLSTIVDLLDEENAISKIIEVELVTGLPSNDLLPENINLIKDFLENKTHLVKKNNKEYLFKIIKTVIIEQPLATLLDLAITNNNINTGVLDNNNIVIDSGAGTTIIDTFFKGKRVQGKSKTFSFGMKNIYEEILSESIYKDQLNINDIEQIIRKKEDLILGRVSLKYSEINKSFKKHLNNFINFELKSELNNLVNNNKRINIYLTGGGANLLSDELAKELEFELVKDSQLAGVRGMLKYNNYFIKKEDEDSEKNIVK